MLKKHKKALIASSLVTLLPIVVGLLLWNEFPDRIATHWGINGEVDGWSSVPFAVFFPPLCLLAVHLLCVWFTAKDPRNQGRNKKLFAMVLWIVPVVSNLSSYLMYALAMGAEFSVNIVLQIVLGLMFAALGNYLPKCKMNSTIGIKVPWAYTSEANWNATHRFGGKCWVIGGLVMVLSALVPGEFGILVMIIAVFALAIIPIAYSYCYYKKQKAKGDTLIPFPKMNNNLTKGSAVFLVAIFLFVAVMMFTGDIQVNFDEDYLTIEASYYNDLSVDYSVIETVEYRDGNIDGVRAYGFGSFRLLMGYFQNEEFGTYTRYTYYKPEACVVLTLKDKTLVLSGETKEETEAIYQKLLALTEQ